MGHVRADAVLGGVRMSGVGIIVGKKACCCPSGCDQLDLRSWLAPTDKYQQLAVTCQLSGNFYRNSLSPVGCSVSWSAAVTGADTDRGQFLDAYGFPTWFPPSNQIVGGGSYPAMYGVLESTISVVGWNAFGAPQLDPSAPPCPGGASSAMGFKITVGVQFFSEDTSESCGFPAFGQGINDTPGFLVEYVKRCCNFRDGPTGTYYRVGPAYATTGVYTAPPGDPQFEMFWQRTAADTLTVTEEL